MEERKASDVLLEIETKVDLLLQYYKLVDFNLKVLINRINELGKKDAVVALDNPIEVKIPKKDILNPEIIPAGEDFPPAIISVDSEIPVMQKLLYNTNAPIRLCNVEIFDNKGNKLKKIRTSHIGKWNSSLFPGDYKIKITRAALDKYPQVDDTYDITVKASGSGSFELPDHKLI